MNEKVILDPCCGSRMFWFDKQNSNTVFGDIRKENHILCDGRELKIEPDIQMDFKKMPFEDKSFKLIVFDPPHLNKLGKSSWMAKKYGRLLPTWEDDLTEGFKECMRCLDDFGVLIFKWNENQIKLSDVLKLFPQQPLFGHTSGRQNNTIWLCFMKGI